MNADERISKLEAEVAALRERTGPGGLSVGPGLLLSQSGNNVRLELLPVAASTAADMPAPPPRGIRYLKSQNGVVTWGILETPSAAARTLIKLVIEMSDAVDDDVRIRIGGVTVYNPRQTSSPRRIVSLYAADIIEVGAPITPGTLVQVDTYDGASISYGVAPWTARQVFSDGTVVDRKSVV